MTTYVSFLGHRDWVVLSYVKVQRQKADGKPKDYELANYIRLHEIIDFVYFAAISSTNFSTFKSLMTKVN